MSMWRLLQQQAGRAAPKLLLTTIGSGVLAAAVVASANYATAVEANMAGLWRAGLFLVLLFAMYRARRSAAQLLIETFEGVSAQLREQLAARMREAPLRSVELLGGRLERSVGDLAFIARTLEAGATGLQQMTFLACVTLSVMLISSRALLLWVLTLSIITLFIRSRRTALRADFAELSVHSGRLGHEVEQLVVGITQAKLDGRVAASLTSEIEQATQTLYARQNEIEERKAQMFIGAIVAMFIVGSGTAAFVNIGLSSSEAYEVVLFFELAYSALVGTVGSLPEMARAEAAATSVLEAIEELPEPASQASGSAGAQDFESLELRELAFTYTSADGAEGFRVGPLNVEFERAQLVMLTGGNGSGKTTLLKLLMGLYPATDGHLRVNGRVLAPGQLGRWRQQFTPIMSQQYLFDRLYGLEDAEPERVEELLARFGLDEVTHYHYVERRFTSLKLSAGQRMRLAMVVALLEARPICVFDEWTANQDPETTHWYYDTLLPELRAAGHTLIVVSHDDRFFDRADVLLRMEDGQLSAVERRPLSVSPQAEP